MSPGPDLPPRAPRTPRREGEDARERLLQAGLRLFAQQGYATTSTREIAEAANVNVAAISYYFGDKAGLYRAVSLEPLGSPEEDVARFADTSLPLEAALAGFYAGFMEPLKQSDVARLCMKLHFREMLEPTGLWDDEIAHGIRPVHDALVVMLCRHLGVAAPDDGVLRLAVCLAGLGVHLHVAQDVIDRVAPGLNGGPEAFDHWHRTLVRFGLAMVNDEAARRRAAAQPGATE